LGTHTIVKAHGVRKKFPLTLRWERKARGEAVKLSRNDGLFFRWIRDFATPAA